MRESDFEVLVSLLRGAMARLATRVMRSWYEAAVGIEVLDRCEAFDAIDFEMDGECIEPSNAWYPEQSLNVFGIEEKMIERTVDRLDLPRDEPSPFGVKAKL